MNATALKTYTAELELRDTGPGTCVTLFGLRDTGVMASVSNGKFLPCLPGFSGKICRVPLETQQGSNIASIGERVVLDDHRATESILPQ
ncbi:MAG: hypothetical protein HY043_16310 [Verrucomicrobia bacterium]|nr:hypothetical protein [Verrucomicrobiota bacterium]